MSVLEHPTPLMLIAFCEGDMEPVAMARWEAHLESCERCRALAESMAQADAVLATPPRASIPFDFTAQVMARVQADPNTAPPLLRLPLSLPQESLVPIAVAVLGLAMLPMLLRGPDPVVDGMVTSSMVYGLFAMVALALMPVATAMRRN